MTCYTTLLNQGS